MRGEKGKDASYNSLSRTGALLGGGEHRPIVGEGSERDKIVLNRRSSLR